ncbi:hypothetical protein B0I35DRAFT_514638 [Stachybotrys elegans]|uniref:RRM domain-containing protein n=1 Tax=Stachybotrys elegans TaxID=80388 RepID=A0A8K0SND8_9HYPO|nr:hypothetical protein B0I35DRAFT_514638 [Stachybotrys elegans]
MADKFEKQLTHYRKQRQLLVARSLHFRTTRVAIEAICRAKLSQPETARFLWEPPQQPHYHHNGIVFIAFERQADCRRALTEFQDLAVQNRPVVIQEAYRYYRNTVAAPVAPAAPVTVPDRVPSPAAAPPPRAPAPSPPALAPASSVAPAVAALIDALPPAEVAAYFAARPPAEIATALKTAIANNKVELIPVIIQLISSLAEPARAVCKEERGR